MLEMFQSGGIELKLFDAKASLFKDEFDGIGEASNRELTSYPVKKRRTRKSVSGI